MANACYNSIVISGDEKALEDLHQKIVDQDKTLIEAVWILEKAKDSDYGLCTDLDDIAQNMDEGPISISVYSKWCAPQTELDDLAKLYPTLTIEVSYEESGNDVFGKLIYKNGEIDRDITMDGDSYYLDNSDEYASLVADIKERKYKDFFREFITEHDPESDEWLQYGSYAEKYVLARVKDRDLPKLINHEWITFECKTEFRRRLGGDHGEDN